MIVRDQGEGPGLGENECKTKALELGSRRTGSLINPSRLDANLRNDIVIVPEAPGQPAQLRSSCTQDE